MRDLTNEELTLAIQGLQLLWESAVENKDVEMSSRSGDLINVFATEIYERMQWAEVIERVREYEQRIKALPAPNSLAELMKRFGVEKS